ncbi:MAG: beta-propeller fold lactonase family protein [Gemmataceae bacterium]|nr:beta-propeller fold lactonase family protein [Gemmataceae bacterium]
MTRQKTTKSAQFLRRSRLFFEALESRITPDATALLTANRWAILSGVPQYLDEVGDILSARVLTQNLPIIGDGLATATGANFTDEIRLAIAPALQGLGGTLTTDSIQTALFDVLGPNSTLNVLVDANGAGGVTKNDVLLTVDSQADPTFVQFNLQLQKTISITSADIGFDIGVPGIGLAVNGSVNVDLTYNWNWGFGVDAQGFYGETFGGKDVSKKPASDMVVKIDAGLGSNFKAIGTLDVFQLTVEDFTGGTNAEKTGLHVQYDVEYSNRTPALVTKLADYRYRLQDPNDINATRLQTNSLKLSGNAQINLPCVASIADNADFPSIRTTIKLDVANFVVDSVTKTVSYKSPDSIFFNATAVNLGDFITRTIKPVAGGVSQALDPLDFLIDKDPESVDGDGLGLYFQKIPMLKTLQEKVPGFSSLPSISSLQGIVQFIGTKQAAFKAVDAAIELVAAVNTIVKGINRSASGNNVWVELGDYEVKFESGKKDASGSKQSKAPAKNSKGQLNDAKTKAMNEGDPETADTIGSVSEPETVTGPDGKLFKAGFSLPILDDPVPNVVNLLCGNYANVDLVKFELLGGFKFDLPSFDFGIGSVGNMLGSLDPTAAKLVNVVLSLLPVDFNASLSGGLEANFQLVAGFDASGVVKYASTGDSSDLASGFYVQSGQIASLTGSVNLGASVLVKVPVIGSEVFKAYATGSMATSFSVNLNDPNNDGKLRYGELVAICEGNIGANIGRIINFTGNADFSIDAGFYFLGNKSYGTSYNSGKLELFDFSFGGTPITVNAAGNFTDINGKSGTIRPTLGKVRSDGTLYLNIGPKASDRGFGNVLDGDETVSVSGSGSSYTVTFGSVTQSFTGVKAIVAIGGEGNDSITITGATVPVRLFGDAGNDILTMTGSGSTTLSGGDGNDTLTAGTGNSTISGGIGDDLIGGGSAADTVTGGAGNDTITGNAGADVLDGGDANDTLNGGAGSDTVRGGDGNDTIIGGADPDNLDGGAGNDTVTAGHADIRAAGGEGNDMFVYDEQTSGSATLVIGSANINSKIGAGSVVNTPFFDFESRQILTGASADIISFSGTLATPTSVDTGAGGGTISVTRVAGPMTIKHSGTTNVGTSGNVVTDIAGALLVTGGDLVLNNQGESVARAISLAAGSITGFPIFGSISFSSLASLAVNLGKGNDTLTINGSPNSNIDMGAGHDVINVPDTNKLTSQVTVAGAGGKDTIKLTAVGAPNTPIAGPLFTANSAESVTLTNAANSTATNWTLLGQHVRVGGQAAANTLLSTAAPVTLLLGSGNDTVTVASLTRAATIDAGGGKDAINIGSANAIDGSTRPLSGITAALSLTAGAGADSISFENSADSEARTGTLDRINGRGRVSGFGMSAAIDFDAEQLTVTAGVNADTVTVNNPSGPFTLNTGAGQDSVIVVAATNAGPNVVNLGQDNDTLTLNGSAQSLTIDGGSETDSLVVDRSAATSPLTGTLTATQLTGLGGAATTFSNLEGLALTLGAGNDTFTINATGSGLAPTVNPGDGDDSVTLTSVGTKATTIGTSEGSDTIRVVFGNIPTTQYAGLVNFSTETLLVDHTAATSGRKWTVGGGRLKFFDGATDVTALDVAGAGEVRILGGTGSDSMTISGGSTSDTSVVVSGNSAVVTDPAKVLTAGSFLSGAQLGSTVSIDNVTSAAGVVLSSDGNFAYFASNFSDAIIVLRKVGSYFVVEQVLRNQTFNGINFLDAVEMIALSPDGTFAYTTSAAYDTLTRYNRNQVTGQLTPLQVFDDGPVSAALDGASELTVSPDSKYVFVAARLEDALSVYENDNSTGDFILRQVYRDGVRGFTGLYEVNALTFSGSYLHVVARNRVNTYTVGTNGALTKTQDVPNDGTSETTQIQANFVASSTPSPDGEYQYSVTFDNKILVVHRPTQRVVQLLTTPDQVREVLFHPGAGAPFVFVPMGGTSIQIYSRDATTGGLTLVNTSTVAGTGYDVAITTDPNSTVSIAITDDFRTLRVYNFTTSPGPSIVLADTVMNQDAGYTQARPVGFSPDGKAVVYADAGGALFGWTRDTTTGALTNYKAIPTAGAVGARDLIYADNSYAYIMRTDFSQYRDYISCVEVNSTTLKSEVFTARYAAVGGELASEAIGFQRAITRSPDGKHIYVACDSSFDSMAPNSKVSVLSIAPNGSLSLSGTPLLLTTNIELNSVEVVSPGDRVIVAAHANSVIEFVRNQSSGSLSGATIYGSYAARTGMSSANSAAALPDGTQLIIAGKPIINPVGSEAGIFTQSGGKLTFANSLSANDLVAPWDAANSLATSSDSLNLFVPGLGTGNMVVYQHTAGKTDWKFVQNVSFGSTGAYAVATAANDGKNVIVGNQYSGRIDFFSRDLSTKALTSIQAINQGTPDPIARRSVSALTAVPGGAFVYGVSSVDNSLFLFDGKTSTSLLSSAVAGLNGAIGLTGVIDVATAAGIDSNQVLVVSPGERKVARYNRVSNTLTFDKSTVEFADLANATSLAVSPNNGTVYIGTGTGRIHIVKNDAIFSISSSATFGTEISDVQVSRDNQQVYAADPNGLIGVFNRTANQTLTLVQTLTNGQSDAGNLLGVRELTGSGDSKFVYAAVPDNSAINVYERNFGTGKLAIVQTLTSPDLSSVKGVTISTDGTMLYASSSSSNTVSVFQRNATSGLIQLIQVVRDNSAGVSGLTAPVALAATPTSLFVGTVNGNTGGLVTLAQDTAAPPTSTKFSQTGFEQLSVVTQGGNDSVSIAQAPTMPVTIDSGGGNDTVVVTSSPASLSVSLGLGADVFEYNAATSGVAGTATAAGTAKFTVRRVGASSSVTLNGAGGGDNFFIAGGSIDASSKVTANGGAGTDSLQFDPVGLTFSPLTPTAGNSTITATGRGSVVYTSIESPTTVAPPVVNAGGPYVITEGDSLMLTASATNPPISGYAWDLNGDGVFGDVTGASVTVTPAHLRAFGLNDNGQYPIAVRATNAQSTGEAQVTLTVRNARPSVSLTGSGAGIGSSVTVNLVNPGDPGDDTISRYWILWGDGQIEEFGSSMTSATHNYATPGTYKVAVAAQDEDGIWGENGVYTLDGMSQPTRFYRLTSAATSFTIARAEAVAQGGILVTLNNAAEESLLNLAFLNEAMTQYWVGLSDEITEGKFVWDSGEAVTYTNWAPGEPNNAGNQDYVYVYGAGGFTSAGVPVTLWDDVSNAQTSRFGVIEYPTLPANFGNLSLTITGPTALGATFSVIEGNDLPLTASFTGNPTDVQWSIKVNSITTPVGSGLSLLVPWATLKAAGVDDGAGTVCTVIANVSYGTSIFTLPDVPLTVTNSAPTLNYSGASAVAEGSAYSLALSATEQGNDTVSSYRVNWGDGSSLEVISATTANVGHIYADNGSYIIAVELFDEDGSNVWIFPVEVTNVAPVARYRGQLSSTQYGTYTLNLSSSDIGPDTISQWTFDWGDGVIETVAGNPSSVSHKYQSAGSFVISAQLTDEDGTYAASPSLTAGDFYWNPATGGNGHFYSLTPLLTWVEARNAAYDNAGGSLVTVDDLAENTFISSTFVGDRYWIGLSDDVTEGQFRWVSDAVQAPGYTNWTPGNPSNSGSGEDYVEIRAENSTLSVFGKWNDLNSTTTRKGIVENSTPFVVAVNPATRTAPTVTLNGAASVNEGSTYNLTLAAMTGPLLDVITGWHITWGDGTDQTVEDSTLSVPHVYADGTQIYTISAVALGVDGNYFANNFNVTVNDVTGLYAISDIPASNNTRTEGDNFRLTLTDSGDPGIDPVASWTVNWGDGTIITYAGDPSYVDHVYADGTKTYTITATVDTGELVASTTPLTVTINDVAPRGFIGGPTTSPKLVNYALSISATDVGTDNIIGWIITWGDGNTQNVIGSPSTVLHQYAIAGNYTVTAKMVNEDGTFQVVDKAGATVSHVVTVSAQAAPQVTITGAPASVTEGQSVTLGSSVVGVGAMTYGWEVRRMGDPINTGNGVFTDVIYAQGTSSTISFTPSNDGVYQVILAAKDSQGTPQTGSTSVIIDVGNVAPTGTLSADGPSTAGSPLTVRFTNPSDPSTVDTVAGFRYSFDFNNDGDFDDQGDINFATESFGARAYPTAGSYSVRGRIWDIDGGYTDRTVNVTVTSPNLVVLNANDSGAGSLRQAIFDANAAPGANIVTFDPAFFATPRTITLASGAFAVTDSISITGPGSGLLTISGINGSQLFAFTNAGGAVSTISNMTLTKGSAVRGGAIYVQGTELTLSNSVITGSKATIDGGAFYAAGDTKLTVLNSTISGNMASSSGLGAGGAIFTRGNLLIDSSTLSSNSVGGVNSTFNNGGAIEIYSGAGTSWTVRNSTIANNSSQFAGGGIFLFNASGILTVENSSIVGNTAQGGVGGGGIGTNSSTSIVLFNSIVSGNFSSANSNVDLYSTGTVTGNFSAIGSKTGVTTFAGDSKTNALFGQNFKLGALGNYGGPTQSIALAVDSPLLNAGTATALTFDQRGQPRNANGGVDIGALERQGNPSFTVTIASDSTDDLDGKTSLREALAFANVQSGANTIKFDPAVFGTSQTITLTGGELSVSDALTVTGPGAALLTISGNNVSRVFNTSAAASNASISLSGMALSNGFATTDGGALIVDDELVTLTNCVVSTSKANDEGGGIYVQTGTLTFVNSAITGNTANTGGGIYLRNASALVLGSTLSGNRTLLTNSGGGGIAFTGTIGSHGLTIRNSTIANNTSNNAGGGIILRSFNGLAVIQNSTIVGNVATDGGGIRRTTIGGNPGTGTISIESSIVSGNSANTANKDVSEQSFPLTAINSAIGVTIGFSLTPGSVNNLLGLAHSSLKLGGLANNGGATQTMAIQQSSPLIGVGTNPAGITTDQRGQARTSDVTDIGAYESHLPARVSVVFINGGAVQRSVVNQVQLAFDSPITFVGTPEAAFSLIRQSDGLAVTTKAVVDNTGTVITLTFTGGAVNGISLADGKYTLTVLANQLTGDGLDGNNDGTGGDNYTFVGTTANTLFRLFGDSDGDGAVGSADFLAFRASFLGNSPTFDFDNDGIVAANDFLAFRLRFLTQV